MINYSLEDICSVLSPADFEDSFDRNLFLDFQNWAQSVILDSKRENGLMIFSDHVTIN